MERLFNSVFVVEDSSGTWTLKWFEGSVAAAGGGLARAGSEGKTIVLAPEGLNTKARVVAAGEEVVAGVGEPNVFICLAGDDFEVGVGERRACRGGGGGGGGVEVGCKLLGLFNFVFVFAIAGPDVTVPALLTVSLLFLALTSMSGRGLRGAVTRCL